MRASRSKRVVVVKEVPAVVTLGIDPAEAWIRWASELHLSPCFDRYAYDVAFLTHLVDLIGEQPEQIADDPPGQAEETEETEDSAEPGRGVMTGNGNGIGIESQHLAAWLQVLNLTRQAGAILLGWHRSSVVKILHRERHMTQFQSERFLQVLDQLDSWQRTQYLAMTRKAT